MAHFSLPRISGAGSASDATPYSQAPAQGDPRVSHIEERIARQERTTRSLLEEAVAIQREIEASFRMVEGVFGGERRGQQLLQDHIRTITTVIRRLNRDVEFLEEFKARSGEQSKQLQQHVAHVERASGDAYNDLRRRLDLIENAVTKVSIESKNNADGLALLRAQVEQRYLMVSEDIRKLSEKVDAVGTRQANADSELRQYVRSLEGELFKRVQMVDTRGTGAATELHSHIIATKKEQDVERARLVEGLSVRMDTMARAQQEAHAESTKKAEEQLAAFKSMVDRATSDFKSLLDNATREQEHRYAEITAKMQDQRAWTERSVKRAQSDVANGLSAVQESLQLSISVLDEKRRLMEEDIRAQLRKIMKTVVVI